MGNSCAQVEDLAQFRRYGSENSGSGANRWLGEDEARDNFYKE